MKESMGIRGVLRWSVRDEDGQIVQQGENHNVVTAQGDALIADLMADSPARTKVDNSNGEITVGTGWTGISTKNNTGVNTLTGSPQGMESTYPKLKGSFGAANDSTVQYLAVFAAGSLDVSGIDEAALGNGTDNLAYAEISPTVNVGLSDTLQVSWEITVLGA
jgi:hypothetical protein